MRTMLLGLAILIGTALIGCATAQEPAARTTDDMASKFGAAENTNKPHIQIVDKREFVSELARLGVSTSIADRDLIKKLFGWTPEFQSYQTRLIARFPQQSVSQSNINVVVIDYIKGSPENEKGGVAVSLHPQIYCIRLDDLKGALGEPHNFFKEGANLWGQFKKAAPVYGAAFKTDSNTTIEFLFEYQECVRRITLTKYPK